MYIHKQNNPILTCIVCFLVVHRILLRFANLGIAYGLGCSVSTQATPQHPFIYISGTVKPTFSWVYQTVNKSPILISALHLYKQPIIIQDNIVGFIKPLTITHALISTINDHFQVSFPAMSSNSI